MRSERTLLLALAAISAFSALGCGADEPAFLPLADLCEAYAEEVCLARQSCCQGADLESCEPAIRETCKAEESGLTQQEDFSYDGRRADRVRRELRAALAMCAAPFPLTRFFRGARALGQPCEQNLQCESQRCVADAAGAMACAEAEPTSLCDPADI